MNIKVDRSLFLNELHYLQGVAGTKQIIPVLSHLLIETGAGRIAMRATDLDLMITTECEAIAREQGSICLPVRIQFKLGNREIVSRLLAGIYPDYSAVLPTENHNRFTMSRDLR